MIDYEKLKIAHEMAFKITKNSEPNYMQVRYRFVFDSDEFRFYAELGLNHGRENLEFRSIDDLISKLQELTKRLPKFKIGQTIYYEVNNKIREAIIEGVYANPDGSTVWYYDNLNQVREEDCYISKESLIDAQISHWTCLKKQEISTGSDDVSMECAHESNDDEKHIGFWPDSDLATIKMKCKKCGDFYR